MAQQFEAYTLDVFVDGNGEHGNPASVVFDHGRLSDERCYAIVGEYGHDETVFVKSLDPLDVRIFNKVREIPFAGQPMVGAAWLLSRLVGRPAVDIHCVGGEVKTWQDNDVSWIRVDTTIIPPWHLVELESPEAVDAVPIAEMGKVERTMIWAWSSESSGKVSARSFAPLSGVPESKGNGGGALLLAKMLDRQIETTHSRGAVTFSRPIPNSTYANLGGRVLQVVHGRLET